MRQSEICPSGNWITAHAYNFLLHFFVIGVFPPTSPVAPPAVQSVSEFPLYVFSSSPYVG